MIGIAFYVLIGMVPPFALSYYLRKYDKSIPRLLIPIAAFIYMIALLAFYRIIGVPAQQLTIIVIVSAVLLIYGQIMIILWLWRK